MSGSYTIPLSGLKTGYQTFDFEIGNDFFMLFEESEIREGSLSVTVTADKIASTIGLDIRIKGMVSVCCDRCLGMFGYSIDCGNRLLIRHGTMKDDSDPEIVIVTDEEHELNLSQYLYEFIHLALPIRRLHPDDESGKSTCDPEMMKKLNEHLLNEKNSGDPRWDELKKLIIDN